MKAKHKKLLIENRDYIYNKSSLRDGSNIAIFLVVVCAQVTVLGMLAKCYIVGRSCRIEIV